MEIPKPTPEAVRLFYEGSLALAQIEHNGMAVDVEYLDRTIRETDARIRALENELRQDKEVYGAWRKRFGERANIGSDTQLVEVLFDVLGHEYKPEWGRTGKAGRYRADIEVISKVGIPFTRKYGELKHLRKLSSTYLKGLKREVCNGFVHPSTNLHIATSWRSSQSDPNLQNQPNRDEAMAEAIRQAIVPRSPDRQLLEIDLKNAEVRAVACNARDPVLIDYMTDPKSDMHWDEAMLLFFLKRSQVEKRTTRDFAKNQWTFPQFYGSVYFQCAPPLWERACREDVKVGERTLKEHLCANGVLRLGDCNPKTEPQPGTFEAHCKKVEKHLWGERFKVCTEWRKSFWAKYQERGWFRTLTGFVCSGIYRRNQVINTPSQSIAFHWLLQLLIWLQRWLRKRRMKSLIVNEIHDSLLIDAVPTEVPTILDKVQELVSKKLRNKWEWINVPVEVECEIAPCGRSWWLKEPIH